ncbi:type I-F CRISPR-associated protein Csy3 [Photobacterium phosphoreum]|uniref:Type I-F CRISPR-associated protein Csy3 n=1 Tax=Photobacterium phosphoreum TaxID=659 RepID=A0AAW4ZMZ7_PHOPO|nr:type I-F CRISPR-associated protein Csy3 [Photobacterium phosphoreum]MCD9489395.1 type I-F CRISPR-associated protein Csy3 [Photobacterium phosphoreum]MCF2188895.1 type I-F CRISPR-associated protein Csy3 [Photobacterium phosphoreum]MCF2300538.1 type I-F CRISPR-associated protein Csy3 [Photobacterium phosphoreum]
MELCSQLAYSRSLWPGKGYFYYVDNNGAKKALATDKTYLRSGKSSFTEAFSSNYAMKNTSVHDLATSNIQYIEECYVPPFVNEINCQFSLRIKANSTCPDVCNELNIKTILCQLSDLYADNGGYKELAYRYAKNVLMGNWLWKNQDCRGYSITIHLSDGELLTIKDAHKLDWNASWKEDDSDTLTQLTDFIANALADKSKYGYMDITACLAVGGGDEVIPSQEFIQDKKSKYPNRQFSKMKFNDQTDTVAFHSQKIGAALQLIDDWWLDDVSDKRLRVNEYGSDRSDVVARRHPTLANDFYTLIQRSEEWIDSLQRNHQITDEVHFIMAVLVKGGLFNKTT